MSVLRELMFAKGMAASGGGSGGGGGVVNLVYDENTHEINASYNDLNGYLQDGKIVQIIFSTQEGGATYTRRAVLSEIYTYNGYYQGIFSTIVEEQFSPMAFVSETATDNLVYD